MGWFVNFQEFSQVRADSPKDKHLKLNQMQNIMPVQECRWQKVKYAILHSFFFSL